ncbi:uncharacterized PE-PGRS family protein PE_PGRS20-like [Lutra lutra]|uniref:uncharacterized PE-PGRS family protein PE_PGRS20-like n=1 Tax=Lutra lutra TaxID=9657 RepID=UPI001FD07DAD|nr:uncharacterized PE-PGRS family protein PE_PGRS20-like [Lutra lutra]
MCKPRTKCRGEIAGGKSNPSPHSSKIRILATAGGSSLLLCIIAAAAAVRRTRGQSARGRRRTRGEPRGARTRAGAGAGGGRSEAGASADRRQRRGGRAGGGGGGGWGSLSPQFRTPRAAGRSSLSGRMSSGSPPLSSPWGSSVEALKTGGRGPSSARRAPRHLCDLAERGAAPTHSFLGVPRPLTSRSSVPKTAPSVSAFSHSSTFSLRSTNSVLCNKLPQGFI